MRRIALCFLLLGLANSTGCTTVADMFFGKLAEKHYTCAGTPEGRRAQYQADVDEQRRIAESYRQENAAAATK